MDSDASLDDVVLTSIKKGIKYLCITDHHEIDGKFKDYQINTSEYYHVLSEYQEKFKPEISILIGVEMGLQPHVKNEVNEVLSSIPFDFVIGSTHLIRGYDPITDDIQSIYPDEDVMDLYFRELYKNIKVHQNYDVCGHIDYPVRYFKDLDKNYSYEKYKYRIDKILKRIINDGKGIEINTSGLRKGLRSTNPCFEIIKRYCELGGEIITVGSDAHTPNDIGSYFSKAKEILIDAGFDHYNIYVKRKPISIPISK